MVFLSPSLISAIERASRLVLKGKTIEVGVRLRRGVLEG